MANRQPFAIDEWYHCYNRGVDKRKVFNTKSDYERFLVSMFVANGSLPVHISNQKDRNLQSVLADTELDRGKSIVEIGSYSLMPNHFHFVLKEIQDGGIALFMQKVFTGYTMYFNKKYERNGPLFAGVFKSKHVANDRYLKWLVSYIHLNAADLFAPKWRDATGSVRVLGKKLRDYPYSSLPDFLAQKRSERKLLGDSIFDLFDSVPTLESMINDAILCDDPFIKVSP